MTAIKGLFANRWFWRWLGAVLLGLLIWFVGPLIAIGGFRPFGWWPVTLVFALLPAIALGLWYLWARARDKKKNAALVDALAPSPGAEDVGEIAGKLRSALAMLRTSKLGKRGAYVYQLPWYAIIGPSKAGKTTALLNAGLNFPTAVEGEYRALRGQPNTPNCDWWFTDEAVLIDTAGRYVSQDEDAVRDAEGWKGFLGLLKQHRPLQPLNGLIVALPAPDFADAAKMAAHAQNVRARLSEVTRELGQNLPVYLLITKADLLTGFREFFARETDAGSDQVFGATAAGNGADNASVIDGFDKLIASISSRVVDRMQSEPDLPRRGHIAAFPHQLASLRTPIMELLGALGHKSRFDDPARIRGVYLASGTQTGNPVDRILMSVGVAATASSHAVGLGRSFFLKRFFSDLVFPERGLAGRNEAGEKRQRRAYIGGLVAASVALVLAVILWTWGYARNTALIGRVYATTSAYSEAAGISRGGTASADQDLAALDVLGKATTDIAQASDFGLGLGQGGRLTGELKAIYGRDLQRRLTPILSSLAETRMGADGDNAAALYDDLKSYLIVGGRGKTDQYQQLLAWLPAAWTASNPGTDSGSIVRHTAALFPDNFKPVSIDSARVDAARTFLRSQPAAVRVYGRLKSKALEQGKPVWTAAAHAGPSPEKFFAMGGSFAPGAGIPALFTREGYDTIFRPILLSGPALLEEEQWVVGETGSAAQQLDPAQMASLKQDLQRLYFDEFLAKWRAYLADIKPRPATSLADNVQRLRDGGGPLSPIAPLMRAIAQATDVTPSKAQQKAGTGLAAAAGVGGLVRAIQQTGVAASNGDDPARAVIAEFLPLRMFVGMPEGGGAPAAGAPAPIDGLLTTMNQLADKLNVVSVLPGGGGEQGSAASLEARALVSQLDQNANSMPAPAGVVAKAVASDASVALGGQRLAQMGTTVQQSFGDACTGTVMHNFPVQPAATTDLAIPDFAHFFSGHGAFAGFVAKELVGYIDTSSADWKALGNAGEIGLTEADVRALQAANLVTRTFFATDPETPRLTYQIEPVALTGAKSVSMKVDGQALTYDGKSAVPATFDWPGAGTATVEFAVEGSTAPGTRSWDGPWAAFRMMHAAAIKAAGSPAIGTGTLTQGGARFDFRVRALGTANPFVVDPFVKVACPNVQPPAKS